MAVLLALLSSLLWGVADFAGGTATRRLPALLVVMVSQAAGLVTACVVAWSSGAWSDPLGYLPWALAAGAAGVVGLLAFYRALATGTMGVISPIAALSVIIPVAVGLVSGHWPSALVGAGFVLAIAGVVAASGPERAQGRSMRPVVLAVFAAVCFGGTLLFIARGAAHSPLMTMVAMRVASVAPLALICLVRRPPLRPSPGAGAVAGVWLLVVVAGLFDVSANLAFAVASTAGALTVVAILGSLYPAVTVLLAAVLQGERMTRMQQAGVALALVGVVLIAGWS